MRPVSRSPFVASIGVASALPLSALAQDAGAGKQLYAQCTVCHAVDNANGVGPGLLGIVGRKSGSLPGFRYSRAMRNANIVWDDKVLDAYIADPQKVVPGNVMPFSGIADAKQ